MYFERYLNMTSKEFYILMLLYKEDMLPPATYEQCLIENSLLQTGYIEKLQGEKATLPDGYRIGYYKVTEKGKMILNSTRETDINASRFL